MALADYDSFADDRHRLMRETARAFAEREVRPLAAGLDESERFPAELYDKAAATGLFGITVPDEMGGVGADVAAYAAVMEELARGYASVADQCGLVELVSTLLAEHGTPEQRARYLTPLIAGRRRCAYAITEAEAGSDVSGVQTTAAEVPGGWRLSGGKLWIHNAPVADFAVVLARTAPALVLSESERLLVSPSPNAWLPSAVVVDTVVEPLLPVLVMMPGAMPRRPSASKSAGPAIRVAVTPVFTAILRPSPPLP